MQKLRFVSVRKPEKLSHLKGHDREPLDACVVAYGVPRESWEDDCNDMLEIWRVEDERGAHAYDVWLYAVDSGSIFRAGTTEMAGQHRFPKTALASITIRP
jgi:hypothetical protein